METRFIKRQMTAAYRYSYTRLALNYYMFYETLPWETELTGSGCGLLTNLNRLAEEFFDGADVLSRLEPLRRETICEVEILTAYADCFQIYEYVLNRLERKFKSVPETGYSDETFTDRLISFITATKDSAVMKERIRQIVSQLPVRMTREKFYSLVMESLSVYIGSPEESLSSMMYILKTGSMVLLPEGMEDRSLLYETLMQLGRLDYRSLSCEAFEEAQAKLSRVCGGLSDETSRFVSLQELINDLYVLSLAGEDAVIDVNEEELCRSIILGVINDMRKKGEDKPEEDYEALLTQLEGRQETYYERYLSAEFPQETPELTADPDYVRVVNTDLLLSGNSFMDLKKVAEMGGRAAARTEAVVDRAYLEKTVGEYIRRLDEVFSTESRPVIRAIMTRVLSDLPVRFQSIDEIQAYIRGCLESCSDEAEKETCKELLEELMNHENKLV